MSILYLCPGRTVLILWTVYTAFAQPGIPACWLEARACSVHAHLSEEHARRPHSHEYLFDLAQIQPAQSLAVVLIPVSLLLALLFQVRIFIQHGRAVLIPSGWHVPIDPPPPKLAHSS